MIHAAIFDMDGLMVDTEPFHSHSFEQVLKEHGAKPVPKNNLVQEIGVGAADNWRRLKKQHDLSIDISVLNARREEVYEKLLSQGVETRPGLIALLEDLMHHNVKIALASSSPLKHIHMVLKQHDLAQYYTALVSADHVDHAKPAPDLFLAAAHKLKVAPEYCVVLEDAPSGVMAAKRAGMKVAVVPNEHLDRKRFSEADMVVDSLEDLSWQKLLQI